MKKKLKNLKKSIEIKFNRHIQYHAEEEIRQVKSELDSFELFREYQKDVEELSKKGYLTNRERHDEKHRIEKSFKKSLERIHRNNRGFQWYYSKVKYTRFFFLIFNLVICYVLFRYIGFSAIGVIYMSLMLLGGIGQILFLASIEKRILIPLQHLNEGVVEIAKGNYGINVACEENSEVDMVIKSFNEMAKRLKEGEELKREYEENRKLLIANISHDLKTPITSIQGYIETMAYTEDLPKETIKKYNQIIYNNAGYMNKLIDDLFLFSKLDMQKLEFNFELINIENFMRDLMEEFQFELEDKNIHFSYESKITKELIVKIDRKRIHQVFRNIIGNAVKYAPTDGSKNASNKETNIDVKLYANNDFINIDIKDNGEGIPEEKLPYIFDRFYRIDYARTKDLMSTGLGLAISKELVDAHGGSIKAESKINEGTCFTITLPIEEGE